MDIEEYLFYTDEIVDFLLALNDGDYKPRLNIVKAQLEQNTKYLYEEFNKEFEYILKLKNKLENLIKQNI